MQTYRPIHKLTNGRRSERILLLELSHTYKYKMHLFRKYDPKQLHALFIKLARIARRNGNYKYDVSDFHMCQVCYVKGYRPLESTFHRCEECSGEMCKECIDKGQEMKDGTVSSFDPIDCTLICGAHSLV